MRRFLRPNFLAELIELSSTRRYYAEDVKVSCRGFNEPASIVEFKAWLLSGHVNPQRNTESSQQSAPTCCEGSHLSVTLLTRQNEATTLQTEDLVGVRMHEGFNEVCCGRSCGCKTRHTTD